MATILDAFFVEVGIDPKKFIQGGKEVEGSFKKTQQQVQRSANEIENSSKQVLDFFGKLRGQVLALSATFLGAVGIKDFIQNITSTGIMLDRTARFTDQSVKELSEWRNVAEQAGGSADSITGSMLSLTQQLQTFALTGESSVIPYFRALGISITDAKGHFKTAAQILLDLAGSRTLKGLDPARQAAILQSLGLDPATTNLIMTNSRAQLQAKLEAQKANAYTAQDSEASKQFTKQWNDLSQSAVKVGRDIFIVMLPALRTGLDLIKQFVSFLRANKTIATGFFLALAAAITGRLLFGALTPLFAMFRLFSAFLSGELFLKLRLLSSTYLPALGDAFVALGAAIEATPIGWILTGLAALVALSYLAVKAWNTTPKTKQSAWHFDPKTSTWVDWAKSTPPNTSGPSTPLGAGGGDILSITSTQAGSAPTSHQAAWAAAIDAQKRYGTPAAVTYAQWALESDYGRRVPAGSNNPFGIKAAPGQASVAAETTEYINGQAVRVRANFAKFSSVADAFAAHAKLLATSPRYAAARARAGDPGGFADALTGVYATDPNYGASLRRIMGAAGSKTSSVTHNTSTKTSANTIHIGTLSIPAPKGGDGAAHARSFVGELNRMGFVGNANYGAA
jgi:flagellum-specific peptidoglycan hydrolase FlgJ